MRKKQSKRGRPDLISLRDIKKKRDNIATLNSITSSLQMISGTKRFQYMKRLNNFEELNRNFSSFYPIFPVVTVERSLYLVISSDQRFSKNFLTLLNKKVAEIKLEDKDELIVFGKYSFKTAAVVSQNFLRYKALSSFSECEVVAERILENGYSKFFVCSYIQDSESFEFTRLIPVEKPFSQVDAIEILPPGDKKIKEVYNPSPQFLRTWLALKIYGLFLKSGLKEESDRSIAMSEASENAGKLTKSLDRLKNQIRQTQITKEITSV